MPEFIEVYDLSGNLLHVMDREKYYRSIKKEFATRGKITTKVKTIRLLLMSSAGRIYLQKRSIIKQENAGFYDKTIGGHVPYKYTWDMAVVKECAEELGFPASTLSVKDYDGPIQFMDGESSGVEVFSPQELEQDVIHTPGKYTSDLAFMLAKYKRFLVPISKLKKSARPAKK